MGDDKSIETVVSGHLTCSSVASPAGGSGLRATKNAQPPRGDLCEPKYMRGSYLTCLKIAADGSNLLCRGENPSGRSCKEGLRYHTVESNCKPGKAHWKGADQKTGTSSGID